jgi:hypothetical protein
VHLLPPPQQPARRPAPPSAQSMRRRPHGTAAGFGAGRRLTVTPPLTRTRRGVPR